MSAAWVAKQHGKRLKKTSFTAQSWPRPSARRAGAQSGESRRTHAGWSRMPDGPVTPRAASSADRSPSAAARPDLEGLAHVPERLVDAGQLGRREPHRPVDPARVQTQQPGARGRGAEPPERRGRVPPGAVVPGATARETRHITSTPSTNAEQHVPPRRLPSLRDRESPGRSGAVT